MEEPTAHDLADLFNFEFNRPCSAIPSHNKHFWRSHSQSNYLFFTKFGGIEGLLKSLKSNFSTEEGSVLGIKGDQKDLADRKARFGSNHLPEQEIKSVGERLVDALSDYMLKILLVGAFASVIIGIRDEQKGVFYGWIEGATILLTFFMVTLMDAFSLRACEQRLKNYRDRVSQKFVDVYRDSETPLRINQNELVVGDIYNFYEGMMIPADSIVIEAESSKMTDSTIECNEELVTGLQGQQKKGVLTILGLEDMEEISNVLYSNSFIVHGEGKALVCAVGRRTQHAMPCTIPTDSELNDDTSPMKDMFHRYSMRMGTYSNYVILALVLFVPIRRGLEFFKIMRCNLGDELDVEGLNPCQRRNFQDKFLERFFQMVIVCVTLVIALIPEAMHLAFVISIYFYSKEDDIGKDADIIFKKIRSLEMMGEVDTICLEVSPSLLEGPREKVKRVYATLKALPNAKLILHSTMEVMDLDNFLKGIMGDTKVFNILPAKEVFEKIAALDRQYKDTKLRIKTVRGSQNAHKAQVHLYQTLEEVRQRKSRAIDKIEVLCECGPGHKFMLARLLKQEHRTVCMSSSLISDCFCLLESKIGITKQKGVPDLVKHQCDIILSHESFVLRALQYGRNLLENMRKYIQFQLIVGINLVLYITIGSFFHRDTPVSPAIILWINCIMDTFSACILASEVPDESTSVVLEETAPFNSTTTNLFTPLMKINIVAATLYQQLVLTLIFYWGDPWWYMNEKGDNWGPTNWFRESLEKEVDGVVIPTDKCVAYTFVYQVFFMMQLANFTNCRFSFESSSLNPFSKLGAFISKKRQGIRDRQQSYWKMYFYFMLLMLFIQLLIVEYGSVFAFKTSGLTFLDYFISFVLGFGIIFWVTSAKWLVRTLGYKWN